VQALAALVDGRVLGDGDLVLSAVGPLEGADGETLSLLSSARYLPEFRSSAAGAVLLRAADLSEPAGPRVRIVVSDPQRAMADAVAAMFPSTRGPGCVHPTATLGAGVRLGREVVIGAQASLGPGVVLGDRVCYRGTRIGRRCTVKAGAVLGGTGFGYISGPDGHRRIPHVGGCSLGDDVDVGANSCIDRGSIDDTIIGSGTRIDNLVHIGHNARLGAGCLLMGGVVIAGSAELGNGVVVAGHAAIGGHFRVGDRARIGAKAGVISTVPAGGDFSGFPARPHREFLRAQAALYRLSRITDELEELVQPRSGDA
jgi:UDP-3-O-[3-hydroxymyristoyl] glucosamine N-acyltransferase